MREKQQPRRMNPAERHRKLTDACLRDRCLVVAAPAHLAPPRQPTRTKLSAWLA